MLKRKWLKIVLLILAALTLIYFLGPRPAKPRYSIAMPVVPSAAADLESYVQQQEARHRLKPDNEARIVWYNDSLKQQTEYSIVYLHGFSASQEDGRPTHVRVAKRFGCNLYLSRLAEHGIDTAVELINLTADKYWESAKQALQIGRQLGRKVILMTSSTGGTLALKLAAAFPNEVHALILMSPNIAIDNDKAFLLNNPWGLQIVRAVTGDRYITASDDRPIYKKYWNYHYPLEATIQLQELIETSMTPATFAAVKQPTLLLYYYKDDIHRDSVVSVPAMLAMFQALGTPPDQKIKKALPDVGDHIMASYVKSKDLNSVEAAAADFMTQVLKMKKANPSKP